MRFTWGPRGPQRLQGGLPGPPREESGSGPPPTHPDFDWSNHFDQLDIWGMVKAVVFKKKKKILVLKLKNL